MRVQVIIFVAVSLPSCSPMLLGQTPTVAPITVTPDVPFEVKDPANLQDAANFAWNEFIALTWPAKAQGPTAFPRGQAYSSGKYGDAGPTGQTVWETFRHKVEVFPGQGQPNGYNASAPDLGFGAKPDYIYRGNSFLGIPKDGRIRPLKGLSNPAIPPFNNLDEVTQITLNAMYAGIIAPKSTMGHNQDTDQEEKILFQAKVNQVVYAYSVQTRGIGSASYAYYQSENPTVAKIKSNSANYLKTGDASKYPAPYIGLPASDPSKKQIGSIEIKAAWRKLNTRLENPKRYYTAPVRYYVGAESNGLAKIEGFVDSNDPKIQETWGLVALHIIHKTPNAPAFVYATFGHIDNILDAEGNPVEEPDGTTKAKYLGQNPFLPALQIIPSTKNNNQMAIKGAGSANTNGKQLYYHNVSGKAVILDPKTNMPYVGPVNINRRLHLIPPTIISANRVAHSVIRKSNPSSVWLNYRLINVQARPLDKSNIPRGEEPTYFLANELVETNTSLQNFSGALNSLTGTITDFPEGKPAINMYLAKGGTIKHFNMGGCMGCHGSQGQKMGGDFSVLLARGRVPFPEIIQADEEQHEMIRALTEKYFGSAKK